ncbi:hypothetical protein VTN00DRAFT_1965 [Thermoascus crustaceus]|uniref:uncharacterized protein n=1 Tax=Thermoascus crustaceus TaxID=5088 RepID=UPI0037431CBD
MPFPFNNLNFDTSATGITGYSHGRGDDAIVIDDDDGGDGAMQIDHHGHGPAGLQHQHGGHQRQQHRGRAGFEGYNPNNADPTAPLRYATSLAHEKRIRSKLREGRHAALCVLMDRELLMVQALSAHETIPQTRRRFLAQLMAPDDPDVATALRADRFTLLPPASTHASSVGPRTIVDVHEADDAGWHRPDQPSSKTRKGKTPERDRDRVKARTSFGGRQTHQHRELERERRRRWSGGERDRWAELDVDVDIE